MRRFVAAQTWQYRGVRILQIAGAALAMTASAARADERRTTVSLGVVVGAQSQPQAGSTSGIGSGFGGPRVTLAWEEPPLPYPQQPGYAVDAGIVPEIVTGAFLSSDYGEAMLGVGLRGELRLSQRQQGLFRISMRGVFYAAARAIVVGDQRDFFGELVFGEYILWKRAGRIGLDVGGMRRSSVGVDGAQIGIVGQLYLGWQL